MAKPQPAAEPSIEDMLSTIRKAIDEESAKSGMGAGQRPAVSGSMREMRVSLQPSENGDAGTVSARSGDFMNTPRRATAPPQSATATTRVTGASKPFGGIMGGDVRLEEAMSRMQRAEQRQEPNLTPRPAPAPAPQATAPSQPAAARREEPLARTAPSAPATLQASSRHTTGDDIRQSVDDALRASHLQPERNSDIRHVPPERPQPAARPAAPSTPPPWPKLPVGRELPPAASAVSADDASRRFPPPAQQPVMSEEAATAAAEAFNRLSEDLFLRSMGGSDQMAATAREMIRPMLKAWLDENLPELVERLVREEIQRVARRGGH